MSEQKIRKPAVAGSFYPREASNLKSSIKNYLSENKPNEEFNDIGAIICPHAGYIYSGPIAAFGYNAIKGRHFDTVILLGPSHHAFFNGISIFLKGTYNTPLGNINIDEDIAEQISNEAPIFTFREPAHFQEHCLEVQLPFLQTVLDNFLIVPMLFGNQSQEIINTCTRAITSIIKSNEKKILIIASSDLSHYHPYDIAVKMDGKVKEYVEAFNYEGLEKDFLEQKIEACGGGAIISAMKICKSLGYNKAKVLDFRNSGDIAGDRSRVVGYMSAIICK